MKLVLQYFYFNLNLDNTDRPVELQSVTYIPESGNVCQNGKMQGK